MKAVTPAGKTQYVKQLQLISGLLPPRPPHLPLVKMFLTSTHWAALAAEINQNYRSSLLDPGKLAVPENFKQAQIGQLLVVNAGTEDQSVVDTMNAIEEQGTGFQWRRDNLKTGYA